MNNIENSNFKKLLGIWKTSGIITSDQKKLELTGIDSYELILKGNYILHKAAVKMGTEKSETFEIIALLNNSIDFAKMHYFNSKGEDGVMKSSIINNEFDIQGKGLKFSGEINDENTLITGKWLTQSEDGNWSEFIKLKLEKQTNK
ncbi:hypothetical protein [Flavobacterium sp. LC2016-12]|uniref:hypothetical protein n=1 Tax=Flavobacterium sp. LC2016-12 TaxID=2783794 RepID=UPI00188D1BFB|nr:hypothetical protein [Flavobacterium sp. LC2016-12]MBF4464274.1 hypothetical protein [Flavobacterium sp. LC2016-12]